MAKLTELRASVLADRIEADLALGEGASLVGELRVLVFADPMAERPRAMLMRALYAAGRQADALAAYHEGRELLADQLGVDPSAQLEQVCLGILRGGERLATAGSGPDRPADSSSGPERAAARAQPHVSAIRVGRPLTSFVGRDEDVSRLLKNLRAARLVTLTGPGGVGKTRLATEASGWLDATAWFVPLAPVTDPAEVVYAVLDTLGIREPVIARRSAEPGAGPLERLAAALADRDEVMILDNCEHVIEAAAALADRVLGACPRMRILATSRQPLRIDGETLYPLLPLSVPPARPDGAAFPVDVASYGSVRMLRDRAVAVRPDFELDEANAEDSKRGLQTDCAVWLGLIGAELYAGEDDTAAVVRQCQKVLAGLDGRPSPWWQGFRAQIQGRLALALLARGDGARCRAVLAAALRDASEWVEVPPLADVIDAIAVLALRSFPGAEGAAILLGAAHSIWGCFDESSLDAPGGAGHGAGQARHGGVRRRLRTRPRPAARRGPRSRGRLGGGSGGTGRLGPAPVDAHG